MINPTLVDAQDFCLLGRYEETLYQISDLAALMHFAPLPTVDYEIISRLLQDFSGNDIALKVFYISRRRKSEDQLLIVRLDDFCLYFHVASLTETDECVNDNSRPKIHGGSNPAFIDKGAIHMKFFYPAVFMPGADCYELEFADIAGCFTRGDDIAECMSMAQDWNAGITKPPKWVLNLILDKILR